ncbi:MAG: LptF/LptG family permease [Bacteroidales bacterium]|nr:LptF/LptG family permease [Bacteroidales bacterium]
MMKTIDYYIIKKFLGTFFYSIALLTVIVIIFDISEKIDDFISTQAPLKEIIFSYYMNFIPYFINLFAYLFTFIAVIFFTSKMASDSEIVAILSSGVSYRRMLLPYLYSAFFLALLSFFLANFIIPRTNKTLNTFEKTYLQNPRNIKDKDIHMQLTPEVFIFVESFNASTETGRKFSLEKINEKGLYYKLTSEKIVWDSTSDNWKVEDYFIRTIDGLNETVVSGDTMQVSMNIKPQDFTIKVEDMKTMNFLELNKFIMVEQMKGTSNILKYLVEKHKRIANPFATIILTLIGVSLSSRKVRGGIGMHLGIGITLTFSYILFMQISTVFATYGNLTPLMAAWIPNIIYMTLALVLLRFAPK